ncbi:MAG TPA: SRPBCC family protein [Gemmatimonadales bacterium]|nr:SRPBCC family protein [Gemmatimonadales bacterium]
MDHLLRNRYVACPQRLKVESGVEGISLGVSLHSYTAKRRRVWLPSQDPPSGKVRKDTPMTDATSAASTRTSRVLKAPREALYRAFTDPAALAVWLSPGEMTGKVHEFEARVGGGYRMSLFYPSSEQVYHGKTSEQEDRFTARFVELTPPTRIVQAISFDPADPAFAGEMTMVVTFEGKNGGTDVTILFEHIPPGIRPEDNEAGTRSSLEKLARYVE